MLRNLIVVGLIFLFSAVGFGQVKASLLPGEVVSVAADKIVLKTDKGIVDIVLTGKTEYKHVSAEKPSFATATPAAFSDISVGDKVVLSVLPAEGGKWQPARTVYLMTKSDIAQKQAKDVAEWRTRGITGRVASVDAAAREIVVQVGTGMNTTPLKVTAKENAKLLRYPPDSINFSDAKPGTLSEIKAGDQIQALGDRTPDGTSMTAEAIVTGAFRQVVGAVQSVDAAKNEIVIKDDATKKDVTVSLASAVMLKRFSPELAGRMLAMMSGGGVRPPGQGNAASAQPPNGAVAGTPRPPFPGGRGGINELVERAPSIAAADLVAGDSIAVLISVPNATAPYGDHIKALKLVAGIEPFKQLAAMAAARGGQGQQGQANLNITIPGLDGGGFQ